MRSIAIEREYGSGGRAVGMEVAKRAGIPYYDSNLVAEAAKDFHVSPDLLREFDERRTGSMLYNLVMYTGYNQQENIQRAQELYYGMSETIKRLARKGPAVFIGRCATEILKEEHRAVNVYIYSSNVEEKLKRIMASEQLTDAEARRLMEKRDRQRQGYFRHWTGKEWADRKNYDLELNTAGLRPEECARILVQVLDFL